nr:hypothetical protein [bacterium]
MRLGVADLAVQVVFHKRRQLLFHQIQVRDGRIHEVAVATAKTTKGFTVDGPLRRSNGLAPPTRIGVVPLLQ